MNSIRCFLLTPIPKVAIGLRRYVMGTEKQCPLPFGYHHAMTPFSVIEYPLPTSDDGYERWTDAVEALRPPNSDARWPTACACGYVFAEDDEHQMFADRLHSRSDGGADVTLHDAEPGALWFAWWYKRGDGSNLYGWDWDNQTTPPLIARTPGGDWLVDGRASNCTLPNDRQHRCWVRHGEPPNVHVDKNGQTCGAGAGSILSGKYHGFLHNGALVQC